MSQALSEGRFFKLICGGSFTELSKIRPLVSLYSQSGIDCIDLAPDLQVIEAVVETLTQTLGPADSTETPWPVLMVSLPLDPDPHFRKMDVLQADCVLCGVCVPVCPTDAIEMTADSLRVSQPLCYGCGRCVDCCPTDALVLHPFLVADQIQAVLDHPMVGAIELHTRYADPYMLADFLSQYGPGLKKRLVSVCFRPDQIDSDQWMVFLGQLQAALDYPLMLQIDGQPMSGSDDPSASLPALTAAQHACPNVQQLQKQWRQMIPVTISGGINQQTAVYLSEQAYSFIAGVGMGTYARQQVWPYLSSGNLAESAQVALPVSRALVASFKRVPACRIEEPEATGRNL